MRFTPAPKQAIDQIIAKGFNYLKIEMEANTHHNRNDDGDDERCDQCYGEGSYECVECDGSGSWTCDECDGLGTYEDESDGHTYTCDACTGTGYLTCDTCEGTGRVTCDDCGGDGYFRNNHGTLDDIFDTWKANLNHINPRLTKVLVYARAYVDGSVDTEITFTIPTCYARHLPTYLQCFKDAAYQATDHELNTENAGLHISIANAKNPNEGRLDRAYQTNFKTQVSKLLFALTATSAAEKKTRSFNFRQPRVADYDKYSYIYTHGGRYYEYRSFDTCYDTPNTIYDYLEAIAGTLTFYSKERVKLPKLQHREILRQGRDLPTIFDYPEAKRRLARELKVLLPKRKIQHHYQKTLKERTA